MSWQARAGRPARDGLMGERSTFQRAVLTSFATYFERSGQPLLAEDADMFARFCDDQEVTDHLREFGPALNNRIRRTLSQLAALGLIAKVTLPKQNLETSEREYLKAFRPLRQDELTRLADVSAIRRALTSAVDERKYLFFVHLDYDSSERSGAGGMFQVISVEDDNGRDMSNLVDQGHHYASLDDLKQDLADALKVDISHVELEAE